MSNQELFSQRGAGLVPGTVTAHIGRQTGHDMRPDMLVTHTLRGEGFDASEDGTGRGTPLVAVYESHGQDSTGGGNTPIVCFGFNGDQSEKTHSMGEREEQAPTLRADGPAHAAMVHWQQGGGEVEDDVSGALRANAEHSYQFARIQSAVRRLTPRECERLQGFPDDHTAVQYRNKPACDGPRYKALGNSMAVPCVEFILHNLLITASSSRRP